MVAWSEKPFLGPLGTAWRKCEARVNQMKTIECFPSPPAF